MINGDIVKCQARYLPVRMLDREDKFGVVIDVVGETIGVEFHDLRHGHNCKGKCEQGKGWYLGVNQLELIEECPEGLVPMNEELVAEDENFALGA